MNRQEILNNAAKVLETVPICNKKEEYDLVDCSWVIADPSFTTGLILFLGKAEKPEDIEEGIKIFIASTFSRDNAEAALHNAKLRIDQLVEHAGKPR